MANLGAIDLIAGRRIYLVELRQYQTYEGLIEGLPTAERNQQRITALVEQYRDQPYPGDPYLIPAIERPIEFNHNRPYPFGTPSALPAVTCIGRFTSTMPALGGPADYSALVILWWQDDYAFPIDPAIFEQFRGHDWIRNAVDLYY